jgi:hypothetical protein
MCSYTHGGVGIPRYGKLTAGFPFSRMVPNTASREKLEIETVIWSGAPPFAVTARFTLEVDSPRRIGDEPFGGVGLA